MDSEATHIALTEQKLYDHMEADEKANTKRDKDQIDLHCKVETIMTNHLPHIQLSLTQLDGKVDTLSERVESISKMMWVVISVAIGGAAYMIEQFISFLIKK